MIGRLRGTLVSRQAPLVLLDVGGIGYEIEVTSGALCRLPPIGAECVLYTHLIVREDAHLLFGFAGLAERTLFRDLIRVNGIGARMALGIVSGMSVNDFTRCVLERDASALTRLPGVGKKSAERLIVEMRDRLGDGLNMNDDASGIPRSATDAASTDPVHEAMVALGVLGYKPHEASRMIRAVEVAGKTSEEIIRGALQQAVVRAT